MLFRISVWSFALQHRSTLLLLSSVWDLCLIRASPAVCHILLDISCVLPTSKKICQVKKNLSPTVWHNSLAKSRSNLHQEPERETKLYLCPSTFWKLKSGTLLCYLFFFHPPTWLETTMPTARRARIFTRWRLVFPKLPKIVKSFAKLLEEYF